MAVWFGHTQTLTSISKSVSTVATGALGLEADLSVFMQKVIYYDRFFQRVRANLPPEVVATAERLLARCYEYRDEIRDELESSLAYVADAGRWLVGLEDWHAKMDKRLAQINELVLLSNSLLVEYALWGQWGARGASHELGAYLRSIADSVVLQRAQPVNVGVGVAAHASTAKATVGDVGTAAPRSNSSQHGDVGKETRRPWRERSRGDNGNSVDEGEDEDEDEGGDEGGDGSNHRGDNTPPVADVDADQEEDRWNPFADRYVATRSGGSSVASLTGSSSVRTTHAASSQMSSSLSSVSSLSTSTPSLVVDTSTSTVDHAATEEEEERHAVDAQEPISPVSLGEYECLEIDAIPQYAAFRPSAMSRKRRLEQQQRLQETRQGQTMSHSGGQDEPSTRSTRRPQPTARVERLMDLTYSYDFDREAEYNPFASPGMGPRGPVAVATGLHPLDEQRSPSSSLLDEEAAVHTTGSGVHKEKEEEAEEGKKEEGEEEDEEQEGDDDSATGDTEELGPHSVLSVPPSTVLLSSQDHER